MAGYGHLLLDVQNVYALLVYVYWLRPTGVCVLYHCITGFTVLFPLDISFTLSFNFVITTATVNKPVCVCNIYILFLWFSGLAYVGYITIS